MQRAPIEPEKPMSKNATRSERIRARREEKKKREGKREKKGAKGRTNGGPGTVNSRRGGISMRPITMRPSRDATEKKSFQIKRRHGWRARARARLLRRSSLGKFHLHTARKRATAVARGEKRCGCDLQDADPPAGEGRAAIIEEVDGRDEGRGRASRGVKVRKANFVIACDGPEARQRLKRR